MHVPVRSCRVQEAKALEQKGSKNKFVIAGGFNSLLPALTEQLIGKALMPEHGMALEPIDSEGVRTALVPPTLWLLPCCCVSSSYRAR